MTTKEHLTKHDREIAAIRTLVKTGMNMLVRIEHNVLQIQAAQKRTEENLQSLMNTLRRGANGHTKRDIQ